MSTTKTRRSWFTVVTRYPAGSLTETIRTPILAYSAEQAVRHAMTSIVAWGPDGADTLPLSAEVVR